MSDELSDWSGSVNVRLASRRQALQSGGVALEVPAANEGDGPHQPRFIRGGQIFKTNPLHELFPCLGDWCGRVGFDSQQLGA